ncbi:MAG: DUF5691 domain-containing protein, partial [Bacteroidota bacterium]
MKNYQDLARTALLGTARTEFPDRLEEMLVAANVSEALSPAQQVLELASFQAQYRKLDLFQPLAFQQFPEESLPLQESTYLSESSIQHLSSILQGHYRPALPEFTKAMKAHVKRFPPEYLPILLNRSLENSNIWSSIVELLGQRAWWLIRQRDEWKPLMQMTIEPRNITTQQIRESQLFVDKLRDSLQNQPLLNDQTYQQKLYKAAFRVDIEQYHYFVNGWYLSATFRHHWTVDVERFLQILTFR